MSLRIKKVDTAPLKIGVAIPPEDPQIRGSFTGNAKIRNKKELKALQEHIEKNQLDDEAIIRELYTDFEDIEGTDGKALSGDASILEVTQGELSAYLVPAAVQAYYAQYGEARTGNSNRSRVR